LPQLLVDRIAELAEQSSTENLARRTKVNIATVSNASVPAQQQILFERTANYAEQPVIAENPPFRTPQAETATVCVNLPVTCSRTEDCDQQPGSIDKETPRAPRTAESSINLNG
jgi:hypothetical protein